MASIRKSNESFNTFITELRVELAELVRQRIETQLEADVEAWLRRAV